MSQTRFIAGNKCHDVVHMDIQTAIAEIRFENVLNNCVISKFGRAGVKIKITHREIIQLRRSTGKTDITKSMTIRSQKMTENIVFELN